MLALKILLYWLYHDQTIVFADGVGNLITLCWACESVILIPGSYVG